MKELYTEIEINASPERVWQVLTDFDHFSEWNPFIKSIKGAPRTGSRLNVRMQPPGGKAMTFRPRVLRSEPSHELKWLGHLVVPGLFDGQHTFKIEALAANRVRFIQREKFKGVLVPLFEKTLNEQTKRGFKEMNEALKARAERAA